jgi:cation:H+ antiporter
MALAFLLLLVGLVFLIVAGDIMVRGAAALARHWGVPALIVGLTIVAFGTSAPEMVVGVQAALIGQGDLAAGNVVGSNIANVLLALGLPALILAIPTNMSGVGRNAFIAFFAAVLFVLLAFTSPMVHWQGVILFLGIIAYLFYMFRLAKAGADDPILAEMTEIDEGEDGLPTNIFKSLLFIVLGIAGLVFGGHLIVDNAVKIASGFGVSETIIGLTIVAIGTSLPEIATVVVATYRGHPEVAIGNVLGSNIFNIFAVTGASALAGPIVFDKTVMVFDIWVMLVTSFVLLMYVLRRQPIGRKTGLALTVGYVLYMLAIAARMM